MTKHTEGPWSIHTEDPHCGYRINGGNGRAIGHAVQRDPHPTLGQGISQEEALANARLFIAAPDLLEAVQELKQLLDMVLCVTGGLPPDANGPAAKALAAIAKATQSA